MVNWVSLFSLATRVPNLLTDIKGREIQLYDWWVGVFQYVIGLSITFVGLTAVEGANLSLLSKVSPGRALVNVGTLTTLLTFAARLAADVQILIVDQSQKLINTDIVNALVIPLLVTSFIIAYFVRRHFFFFM
jgi:hypothetical protein